MSYLTVNPRIDGQVIYVHPKQGFVVELSVPSNSDWKVECFSEYFISVGEQLEEPHHFTEGRKIYRFQQLYDLNKWAKVSSVQLAEVLIQFKGEAPPNSGDRYKNKTLYVVLQGENEDQRDTLTLINPICTKIRMAPHQLLEVVIFDKDIEDVDYECLIDTLVGPGQPDLSLDLLAVKYVTHCMVNGKYTDINNDPHLINRHTFNLPINPKIEESSPLYPPMRHPPKSPYQAKHFFLQMTKKCVETVQRLPNGNYEVGELTFYDEKNDLHAEYAAKVLFSIKGANKPKLRQMGLSRRQRLMTEEHVLGGTEIGQIGRRILDREKVFEQNRLLTNPGDRDNVDFVVGHDNFLTIEIAPPKVWNNALSETAKWIIAADPVWQFRHRHMPEYRLTTQDLDSRIVQGTNIQRFMVTPVENATKNGQKQTFLGLVKLTCKEGGKAMTRCVSFYITNTGVGTSKKSTSSTKRATTLPMAPLPPQIIKIQIEELVDDDICVFGCLRKKFTDINLDANNSNKKKKTK